MYYKIYNINEPVNYLYKCKSIEEYNKTFEEYNYQKSIIGKKVCHLESNTKEIDRLRMEISLLKWHLINQVIEKLDLTREINNILKDIDKDIKNSGV